MPSNRLYPSKPKERLYRQVWGSNQGLSRTFKSLAHRVKQKNHQDIQMSKMEKFDSIIVKSSNSIINEEIDHRLNAERAIAHAKIAEVREAASQIANFRFLGEDLSGKIKTHLEDLTIWPESIEEAISILQNQPFANELTSALELLQIPQKSALAKALFHHYRLD